MYIAILPLCESPNWCNELISSSSRFDIWMDCRNKGTPFSELPALGPVLTTFVDLLCVFFLGFVKYYKTKWKT